MKENETVLLRTRDKDKFREYLTTVSGKQFHCEFGIVETAELRNIKPGGTIVSHMGQQFSVIRPRAPDMFRLAKRTGAPIMPKDVGQIISHAGINSSDRVLEAGTGSGVLAIYLGSIAKEVISYEVREDFVENARANLSMAGLSNVEVRCGDIVDVMKHDSDFYDVIVLDIKDSAESVKYACSSLIAGGFLVVYSPFIEQAKAVYLEAVKAGFYSVHTLECLERELSVSERGTRPAPARVGHTGYLTFARK